MDETVTPAAIEHPGVSIKSGLRRSQNKLTRWGPDLLRVCLAKEWIDAISVAPQVWLAVGISEVGEVVVAPAAVLNERGRKLFRNTSGAGCITATISETLMTALFSDDVDVISPRAIRIKEECGQKCVAMQFGDPGRLRSLVEWYLTQTECVQRDSDSPEAVTKN